MKYRRIFQMILVCITGILFSGCMGQTEEQEKEKARYTSRFNNTDIQDGGKCFARD